MSPNAAARIAGLHLLTYRPTEMISWWAALLGGQTQRFNTRMTTITAGAARVVIQHADIALDYHPEASGVTVIDVSPGSEAALRDAMKRLADIGSHPHRASRRDGVTALWFRDPNGTDVTLALPHAETVEAPTTGLFPDELDPAAVLQSLTGISQP
jgi:catechol-2,3-dioxygenase